MKKKPEQIGKRKSPLAPIPAPLSRNGDSSQVDNRVTRSKRFYIRLPSQTKRKLNEDQSLSSANQIQRLPSPSEMTTDQSQILSSLKEPLNVNSRITTDGGKSSTDLPLKIKEQLKSMHEVKLEIELPHLMAPLLHEIQQTKSDSIDTSQIRRIESDDCENLIQEASTTTFNTEDQNTKSNDISQTTDDNHADDSIPDIETIVQISATVTVYNVAIEVDFLQLDVMLIKLTT